jgi:hypothetical protein
VGNIWKETIVSHLKVPPKYLLGDAEEKQEYYLLIL